MMTSSIVSSHPISTRGINIKRYTVIYRKLYRDLKTCASRSVEDKQEIFIYFVAEETGNYARGIEDAVYGSVARESTYKKRRKK